MKKNIPIFVTAGVYASGLASYLTFFPQIAERFSKFCIVLNITATQGLILISIPLIIALSSFARERLKNWQLSHSIENDDLSSNKEDWFRLRPFFTSDLDINAYKRRLRPDGIEQEITDWIENSRQKILFLTGKSGTGKSSIIAASVIPNLMKRNPIQKILTIRIYNNPTEEIKKLLLAPNEIWSDPSSFDHLDLRILLEEATHLSPLLLIIDQFEELLILHNEEVRAPFEAFLKTLTENPIPDLKILLVCRDDYLPELERAATFLPALRAFDNWRQIGLFSTNMAQDFLVGGGYKIGKGLMSDILKEAREVEENRGQYRPIVLNMIGLALERNFRPRNITLPIIKTREGMLRRFLKDQLGWGDLPKRILLPMITENGTKRVVNVIDLVNETQLHLSVVVSTLRKLSSSGIVRQVSEQANTWEISHDFVARLLVGILNTWKTSIVRVLRVWSMPLLSVVLLLTISLFQHTLDQKEFLLSRMDLLKPILNDAIFRIDPFALERSVTGLVGYYGVINATIVDYNGDIWTDVSSSGKGGETAKLSVDLIDESREGIKWGVLTIVYDVEN